MDMLLSLIFVQNVCKDYQQTTKVLASEERMLYHLLSGAISFLYGFWFPSLFSKNGIKSMHIAFI